MKVRDEDTALTHPRVGASASLRDRSQTTAVGLTPSFASQKVWIEQRGLLVWIAFFLGGLGGGLYLISLFLDFYIGLVTGFLIVGVGKGATHLAYLGRPLRFWRAFFRPQSSWLSRGVLAMTIFLVFGALQIAPSLGWFSWLPWTSDNLAIQIIVTIAGLVLITYTGFTLSVVKAIPFWNTALLPIIFLVYSILGGASLALVMLPLAPGTANVESVEVVIRWLLIIAPVLLAVYLWGGYSSVPAARRSVFELLKGSISLVFVGGVVVLGLAIPLAIVGYSFFVSLPYGVLVLAAVCEFIGGLLARYSILKAGIYSRVV